MNWWNTNNFPIYLSKLHENPWDIIDKIAYNLKDLSITIDINGNQLNNKESFSKDVMTKFFQQFANKSNFYLKIYDPLNDKEQIEQLLEIANQFNVNIIGGIFLRPDLQNYPECHKEVIKIYKKYSISYISLIEPLGLLKSGQIEKIKILIDNSDQISQINLSFKHLRFQQSLLINEAFKCGISEFDYGLISSSFGYPSLEAIIQAGLFSEKAIFANKSFYNLYSDFKSTFANKIHFDNTKTEIEKDFLENPQIPLEILESILNLQYFTNIGFSLQTIIDEIKKVQSELGNPPFVEPFQTIIISQAIFRLQNSNKSIKTLATIKYASGYWGKKGKDLKNEFENYLVISNRLIAKSRIFDLADEQNKNSSATLKYYRIKDQNDRLILLFLISPKEANYFYNQYLVNPKSIDFSNKKNLAILVKTIFESNSSKNHELRLPEASQEIQGSQNDFRWRYLSRLFQMGKF